MHYEFEIEADAGITRAEKGDRYIRFRSDFNGEVRWTDDAASF